MMNQSGADMQIQELRDRLAAVTVECDAWKQEADDERKSMRGALQIMQERAELAEAALATANERIRALAERLGIYST